MGADWRKPRIVFESHGLCQTKSGKQRLADKKNATQSSRVKSTPKEEGGGDKPEPHTLKPFNLCSSNALHSAPQQN